MDRKQIKKMLLAVMARADYDMYKSFRKETAEEWEYSKGILEELIDIAESHVKKSISKPKTKTKAKAKTKKRRVSRADSSIYLGNELPPDIGRYPWRDTELPPDIGR